MRVLLVTYVDPWVRSVSTVHKWVAAGRALGHDVAVYGDPHPDLPALKFSTDLSGVDVALFIIQVVSDFPEMPRLVRLLDGIPREKRVVVDLWGHFNDTIRLEHDFNHLEKLDNHQGWEWEEAIAAVSDTILQPTLEPLRPSVGSFLFHGFDPGSVARPYATAARAAAAWREAVPAERPYGFVYVGNNWQRWEQMRRLLEDYAPVRAEVGRACLIGWDWSQRPAWAIKQGIAGIDTDPAFLAELGVELRPAVRFDEVRDLVGQGRFTAVFHRPLFRHLGYATIRTFETFEADALPILMLPRDYVEATYGPAALALAPGDDVGALMKDALRRPRQYWQAVLDTRDHLARHHSFARRFQQLEALVKGAGRGRA
jgi:hypothetical protein